MSDLIERMTREHYARASGGGFPWEKLDKTTQDRLYDSMWFALGELREPTEKMLEAAIKRGAREKAWGQDLQAIAGPRAAYKMKMAQRFTAMIEALREIPNGKEANQADARASRSARPR